LFGFYLIEGRMVMDKLEQAREIINSVDREIAGLFCRRMDAVRMVAEYKKERGLPIFDAGREALLLAKNAEYVDDDELKAYYISFQKHTMEVSKTYQRRLIEGVKIAYSGVEGAFAHIASGRIFPDGQSVPYEDFQAAYQSVVDGECECAVLPIENSYAGEVGQVMDLMFSGSLYVNGVYDLPVTHNLLGVPGSTPDTITAVISHPQALKQCGEYIKARGYEVIQATNTAIAAQSVAEKGDIHTAAIASAETAELYGLRVLDHDINESSENTTRFAVFSRVPNHSIGGRDKKFLLLFTVNNVAGALAKAISIIGEHGFNMRALRSRPLKELAWQYYFYVEAEGDENSEAGKKMLAALDEYCDMLKVVGGYTMEVSLQKKRGEEE